MSIPCTINDLKQAVEIFSPAEVTQLEDSGVWVDEQVLRLDVSVTHTLGMDVSQTAEQLVHVDLRRDRFTALPSELDTHPLRNTGVKLSFDILRATGNIKKDTGRLVRKLLPLHK